MNTILVEFLFPKKNIRLWIKRRRVYTSMQKHCIKILVCLAKLMLLCKVSSDRVRGLVDYQSLVPIMLRVDERSDNDLVVDERSDNV